MTECLSPSDAQSDHLRGRDMLQGLQRGLEKNYARVLHAAGREWERRFAGKDPSDACITVSVSGSDQTFSGPPAHARRFLPLDSQAA